MVAANGGTIAITQAQRRIAVQYAKRVVGLSVSITSKIIRSGPHTLLATMALEILKQTLKWLFRCVMLVENLSPLWRN